VGSNCAYLRAQTPHTASYPCQRAALKSNHGTILSCEINVNGGSLTDEGLIDLCKRLEGMKYGSLPVGGYSADDPRSEVWRWLHEAMTD
jgi:hypothetical protein